MMKLQAESTEIKIVFPTNCGQKINSSPNPNRNPDNLHVSEQPRKQFLSE